VATGQDYKLKIPVVEIALGWHSRFKDRLTLNNVEGRQNNYSTGRY
jgi:hypothetical protein